MSPMNGATVISSSQAVADEGFRLMGTNMKAATTSAMWAASATVLQRLPASIQRRSVRGPYR